jgi:hypothetical protein
MDYLELGPTPVEENCAQCGVQDDFTEQNKIECRAFKNQLQRLFPTADLRVKAFPHDFGTYREVCVYFDENDEKSCDVAYAIENSVTNNWDDEAIVELKAAGYRHLRG